MASSIAVVGHELPPPTQASASRLVKLERIFLPVPNAPGQREDAGRPVRGRNAVSGTLKAIPLEVEKGPVSEINDPKLSPEQRAWFGLGEHESIRVLTSGARTILLERQLPGSVGSLADS